MKRVKNKEKALIVQDSKYYAPRNPYFKSGKENDRAKRVEGEYVMLTHNFGKHLPCWNKGVRRDNTFRVMESDILNFILFEK